MCVNTIAEHFATSVYLSIKVLFISLEVYFGRCSVTTNKAWALCSSWLDRDESMYVRVPTDPP